jgi:uncharacterized membrane protein
MDLRPSGNSAHITPLIILDRHLQSSTFRKNSNRFSPCATVVKLLPQAGETAVVIAASSRESNCLGGAMQTRRGLRLPLGVVVGFLALVGVGASATHYLQEPYNPGFLRFPTIVALHVVLGGVYLALAPFQLVKRIRSRHPGYHRRVGRLLVAVGLVAGVTALFMGLVIPFSGWAERVIIGLFGGFFLFALVKGFLHVRAGRVALHREWMIRAFALGLSIATMRLIFVPTLLIVADPTHGQIALLSVSSFAAAFVLNTTVAELWIRATRRSNAPTAGEVKAA